MQARKALNAFLPILEGAGFEWVEKAFYGYNAQANSIATQRERIEGQIEFITTYFHMHRHLKFQVISGVVEKGPPDKPRKWFRAGDIVRYQSELDRAKWWGPKWWHVNKTRVYESHVKKVETILPELINFLTTGEATPNIWVHDLSD